MYAVISLPNMYDVQSVKYVENKQAPSISMKTKQQTSNILPTTGEKYLPAGGLNFLLVFLPKSSREH